MSKRLVRLIDRAVNHFPIRFDRAAGSVLHRAAMPESAMPEWYRGGQRSFELQRLPDSCRNKAAPVLVWLRTDVERVMKELAADTDATNILLGALPTPQPEPRPLQAFGLMKRGTKRWARFNAFLDTPPVHLWVLWRYWQRTTGLGDLPPAPEYPGVAVLQSKASQDAFLSAVSAPSFGPLMLRADTPARGRLVCKALEWLRRAMEARRKRTGGKAKKKPRRGAPTTRDAKKDKRLYEARKARNLSYPELAREFFGDETKTREVAKAVDSHRHRLRRMGKS